MVPTLRPSFMATGSELSIATGEHGHHLLKYNSSKNYMLGKLRCFVASPFHKI